MRLIVFVFRRPDGSTYEQHVPLSSLAEWIQRFPAVDSSSSDQPLLCDKLIGASEIEIDEKDIVNLGTCIDPAVPAGMEEEEVTIYERDKVDQTFLARLRQWVAEL